MALTIFSFFIFMIGLCVGHAWGWQSGFDVCEKIWETAYQKLAQAWRDSADESITHWFLKESQHLRMICDLRKQISDLNFTRDKKSGRFVSAKK